MVHSSHSDNTFYLAADCKASYWLLHFQVDKVLMRFPCLCTPRLLIEAIHLSHQNCTMDNQDFCINSIISSYYKKKKKKKHSQNRSYKSALTQFYRISICSYWTSTVLYSWHFTKFLKVSFESLKDFFSLQADIWDRLCSSAGTHKKHEDKSQLCHYPGISNCSSRTAHSSPWVK